MRRDVAPLSALARALFSSVDHKQKPQPKPVRPFAEVLARPREGQVSAPRGRGARDPERPVDREPEREPEAARRPAVPLDPLDRHLSTFCVPPAAPVTQPAPAPSCARDAVAELAERLLRRVALGGTRRRGTALLTVGAGALQGASIAVHAEGRRVDIEIDGVADRALVERLERRLRDRGLDVTITVS